MTTTLPDPRIDRLYRLLPAIYRMRDAAQGYPLQALLRAIAEQVDLVEDDIAGLYDNWFIETCEEWVVPYIADLIGYRPVLEVGTPGLAATGILIPRREVANTIRYRRRKGTLALLELLARDVAGWPARAVEYFKLLGWRQHLNHLNLSRARLVDVRRVESLDLIDGPFDTTAHTVDVRRINSGRTVGRHNIPSVGVWIWRLRAYSVTGAKAYAAEAAGPNCCTFSVLGQDAPLFIRPEPEPDPTHIAEEANLPAPLRRLTLAGNPARFYGADRSLAIWADDWADFPADQPIPVTAIVPADLSGWRYVPPRGHIAVDPVLGRFAFPVGQVPKKGVRVNYHYGFSADIGGGEYLRGVLDPSPRSVGGQPTTPRIYRVGKGQKFTRLEAALGRWQEDDPWDAVIELTDGGVYVEPIAVNLRAGRTLQLRAANGTRPVIRLLDWQTDLADALAVTLGPDSRFTLDGLLVTGRPLHVTGPERPDPKAARAEICGAKVVIRHCTFVPGWGIDRKCEPKQPSEPSLQLTDLRAEVRIERSILGSIEVNEDEVALDPIPIRISDSILDATDPDEEAIGSPGYAVAHAVLTIVRSTVFGIVDVHAIELAENDIFMDCVNVARRQRGCVRFSYVPPSCRTPRRYHCQPDLVVQAVRERLPDHEDQAAEIPGEQARVRPQFTSRRYGTPGYAQLARTCASEITRGADDESEMGVFHDLFQPQREARLRARLEEHTPAGMDVGVLFVT